MKKLVLLLGIITISLQIFGKSVKNLTGKDDSLKYKIYRGKIIDRTNNEKLEFVTISVKGTNIATISNSEGEFILKISENISSGTLLISHIGYENKEISVKKLHKKHNIIQLSPTIINLNKINIYPHDPEIIVQGIIKHLQRNYAQTPNSMEGFYRETVQKNRKYITIVEAVVNIYKSAYKQGKNDQVKIFKGRKNQNKKDTLLIKLQGGPITALQLDIIKNPDEFFSPEAIKNYDFTLKSVTEINGKLHYIVEFRQKKHISTPLYTGILYIERDNLALTSAKFNLNLENTETAQRIFVKKKPIGVKIIPIIAQYTVNYKENNGKWYFTYSRAYLKFKCNWKRKLFNKTYTITSELAITDRNSTNIARFKTNEKFKNNQIMVNKLSDFADINFWGKHNTIEPEQPIEAAIRKLKRQKNNTPPS